jgi:two-component system LytT family response regulator
MRAVIVDDEAPARNKLRRLLRDIADLEVVGEADSGLSALECIATQAPDVVLLDVQMPELDGFGVVQALDVAFKPSIVFVTAHDEYAVRAFEAQALDYLLKPVAAARLSVAIERARAERLRLDAAGLCASLDNLRSLIPARQRLDRLFVKDRGRVVVVPIDDVDHVEAAENYVRLCTTRGEFLHRSTVTALAAALDPQQFVRVSRSSIVRLRAVREIRPVSHGDRDLVLESGAIVRWSRLYRAPALTAAVG